LSTHQRERLERIEQILECLSEETSRGALVIVEGRKDVETLRLIGIQGNIVTAKTGGKSRLDLLSQIEEDRVEEVILLFDFDRRGREWTETVKEHLERAGVKPNLTFWNDLLSLAGREVKDIEGLAAYLETLRRKVGQVQIEKA